MLWPLPKSLRPCPGLYITRISAGGQQQRHHRMKKPPKMTKAARKIARKTKQAEGAGAGGGAGAVCISRQLHSGRQQKSIRMSRTLQQCSAVATTPLDSKQNQTKNVAANAISGQGDDRLAFVRRCCCCCLERKGSGGKGSAKCQAVQLPHVNRGDRVTSSSPTGSA